MGAEAKRISIEDARSRVLEQLSRLEGEEVALAAALGRVLAQDAVAPTELPPFHSSGMDGFGVIATDTADAPVALKVIGESRAGRLAQSAVTHGTAIRISTGAVVPDGADAVVRQELTEIENGAVIVNEGVQAGTDVRYAGEDIRKGDHPARGHAARLGRDRRARGGQHRVPRRRAQATDRIGTLGRTAVIRCHAKMHDDGWHVTPTGDQRSHILTSVLGVPVLALVPEDCEVLRAGEPVDIEFVG